MDDFYNCQVLCRTSRNLLTFIKKQVIKNIKYMNTIFIIKATTAVDSK